MKAITKVVVSFFVLTLAVAANANDFAVVVGMRSNSADAATAGQTVSSLTGYGAGVLGFFDLSGSAIQGRAGFIYNQRNVEVGTGANKLELNANYFDIPLTAMYKFADYGGVFAGPVLGLKAGSSCKESGTATCTGIDTPSGSVVGLQLGASFKFAPQMGAEIYYESIPTEYWKNKAKNMTTVGANFLFTFD